MAMSWGKVTTLTSDPAYPGILFPEPFGPGRGLGEVLKNSKCLSWWKIILSAWAGGQLRGSDELYLCVV